MKTWKNLLIPGIVLFVLIASLLVGKVLSNNKTNPSDATDTTFPANPYVLNYTPDQISSIHVLAADGTGYSIQATDPLPDGSLTWTYVHDTVDYSKYVLSQPNLATYISIMSTFQITDEITSGKDTFPEYGLDQPSYTLTYSLANGEKHTLLIGDAVFDDSGVYCTLDDTNIVYTIDKIKKTKCGSTILDFLDMKLFSFSANDIASVSMKRPDDPVDLSVSRYEIPATDSADAEILWQVNQPFQHDASPFFNNLIDAVISISVTSFVEINATDMQKYGLDQPAYVFDFVLNSGEQAQMILSKDMGGIYYGASTTSPGVFTLSTEIIAYLQTPLLELINPYVNYVYLRDVKHIDATFPEGSFYMDMAVAESETALSPNSEVSLNGQSAKVVADEASDGRSYFSMLFESISVMNITEFDFSATPINTKDITIVLTMNNTKQITIDLAVRDQNTYYAFIDGAYEGFIVHKDELYKDNGTFLYEYGVWSAYTLLEKAIRDKIVGVYSISDS